MSKNTFSLVWYDNGKTLYKVFICSLAEVTLKAEMKKLLFKDVRILNHKQERIF